MNTAAFSLNSPSATLTPGQTTLALIGRVLLAWLFIPAGFNKNLAVVGGLLVLAAFGAGGFSLDGRRRNKA